MRKRTRIQNLVAAGRMDRQVANTLLYAEDGNARSLALEQNEQLLKRLDAVEARKALMEQALRPEQPFGRA
jgi:hypothetical protein